MYTSLRKEFEVSNLKNLLQYVFVGFVRSFAHSLLHDVVIVERCVRARSDILRDTFAAK